MMNAVNNIKTFDPQNIRVEKIKHRGWCKIEEGSDSVQAVVNGKILSITVPYEGAEAHSFRAYVLDKSSGDKKIFTLIIFDQNTKDTKKTDAQRQLNIDLVDAPEKDTKFEIYKFIHPDRIEQFASITT